MINPGVSTRLTHAEPLLPKSRLRPVARHVFLALVLAVFPAAASAGETVYPPGLAIGLTPPDGMLPAGDFLGFEDQGAGAAITVFELPAEAFARISGDFSVDALRQQGIENPQRENVALEGAREAVIVTGEQQAQGVLLRKWILVAGAEERTALVVAEMIAGNARYSDASMRAALMSVAFRPPPSIEERVALLPYRVGDTSEFRPISTVANNTLFLTMGPADSVEFGSQPLVAITEIAGGAPPEDLRETFARQALMGAEDFRDVRIERSQSFRQRNADWHEIVAIGKSLDGRDIVVIQTLRFTQTGLIRVIGIARASERAQWMPRFRRIIDSVEPR